MNIALLPMLRRLISDSNLHVGLRVMFIMVLVFIVPQPAFMGELFAQSALDISISLCLGVMAAAIVENDDNHIGRRKFLLAILACFFIASSSVELLMPYPVLFGGGLLISSFVFMMLGTLGVNYSKVGFGAILIAIYTMVGYREEITWFEQPILLTLGTLSYGLFSIVWNYYHPNRSLREQLAQLFFTLSRYQRQKASLFNEVEGHSQQALYEIRQQLAIHNIAIMARLQQSQNVIQSRLDICIKQDELQHLNHLYIVAEQIHERISASQYLYSQLENSFGKSQILEGYHQLLLEISENCYQLGLAIGDNKTYQCSRRLNWTIKALADQLQLLQEKMQDNHMHREAMLALQAIYDNIKGIEALLSGLQRATPPPVITLNSDIGLIKTSFFKRLFAACSAHNNTFKHAVRISISLLLAFITQYLLQLENGFWLPLTVLFVCQPSFSETRKRLIQRILGTLVGVLLGYPIMLFIDAITLQVLFMIASAFFFFNYLRTNYALAVTFITIFVMSVANLLDGSGIAILPDRIIQTLLGGVLSVLAISFIFPDWQFQRFPLLVTNLLNYCNRYFNLIATQYQYGRSENLNYRITRLHTFQADASLTSAWQSMLFEPTSKQQLHREVYALVNRCDALVSYIAALASHRHKMEQPEEDAALQRLMNATARQIALAYGAPVGDEKDGEISIEEFDNYKDGLSDEGLLIVEQLRLIAFTAVDIQLLLHKVNFSQPKPH